MKKRNCPRLTRERERKKDTILCLFHEEVTLFFFYLSSIINIIKITNNVVSEAFVFILTFVNGTLESHLVHRTLALISRPAGKIVDNTGRG